MTEQKASSKPWQFSKENQPDPATMRKPKIRSMVKAAIRENWGEFEKKLRAGDRDFWRYALEGIKEKGDNDVNLNVALKGNKIVDLLSGLEKNEKVE